MIVERADLLNEKKKGEKETRQMQRGDEREKPEEKTPTLMCCNTQPPPLESA